jgi:hypothetical protein
MGKYAMVTLTPKLRQELSPNTMALIKAGNRVCQARISTDEQQQDDSKIFLNHSAAKELKLPVGSYHIYDLLDNQIYIGPVVAVMSSAVYKNHYPRGKTGRMLRELIQYARERGIFVYLFGLDGIVKDLSQIRGISIKNNSWQPGIFPWPDIIYNRIRLRKIERLPKTTRLLRQFNVDKRIYFFNSRYLNKREVYEALKKHPDTESLIPDTRSFGRANLQSMLKAHDEVFMKPNHGSIGKGIYKIKKLVPGRYAYAAASSTLPVWKGPYAMEALYQHLRSSAGAKRDYLLQQAIKLARFKSRVFDVRSQMQKNMQGEWVLTGAAVRVAARNKFVTHIPNGGRAEVFEQVMLRVFPSQRTRKRIDAQIDHIVSSVPPILEKTLGINLAILTMDLGIDEGGKVWILEVNSKPSSFDEDDIRMKHLEYLCDYFINAARQKNRKGIYEA